MIMIIKTKMTTVAVKANNRWTQEQKELQNLEEKQ